MIKEQPDAELQTRGYNISVSSMAAELAQSMSAAAYSKIPNGVSGDWKYAPATSGKELPLTRESNRPGMVDTARRGLP